MFMTGVRPVTRAMLGFTATVLPVSGLVMPMAIMATVTAIKTDIQAIPSQHRILQAG